MKRAHALWLLVGLLLAGAALSAGAWATTDVPKTLPAATKPAHGDCHAYAKPKIAELELAGTETRARKLVGRDPCTAAILRESLRRDPVFILSYVALISCFCAWGGLRFRSRKARALGWVSIGVVLVAAGLDLVENALLDNVIGGKYATQPYATAASLAKWSLLVVPAAYALGALVTIVSRLVKPGKQPRGDQADEGVEQWKRTAAAPAKMRSATADGATSDRYRWWWAARPPVPGAWGGDDRDRHHPIGIAFSGGGIRSASFHLGVLEELVPKEGTTPSRLQQLFTDARYIATVSGGGYVGIARQITLHAGTEAGALPAPDTFAAGTLEQKFVSERRRFLWDNLWLMLLSVATLVAGIVANIALFGVLIYVAARPIGWFAGAYLFGHGLKGGSNAAIWLVAGALGVVALAGVVLRKLDSIVGSAMRAVALCFGASGAILALCSLAAIGWGWTWIAFAAAIVAIAIAGVLTGPPDMHWARRLVLGAPGAVLGAIALACARAWIRGAAIDHVGGQVNLTSRLLQLPVRDRDLLRRRVGARVLLRVPVPVAQRARRPLRDPRDRRRWWERGSARRGRDSTPE